jgi:hypothetical protein
MNFVMFHSSRLPPSINHSGVIYEEPRRNLIDKYCRDSERPFERGEAGASLNATFSCN